MRGGKNKKAKRTSKLDIPETKKGRSQNTQKEPTRTRVPLSREAGRERQRLSGKAKRERAKSLSLRRHCGEPAIEGQTRCETCAECHRVSRRAYDGKRREAARQLCIREKHDTLGPLEKRPPPQLLVTISYQRATPEPTITRTVLPEVSPCDTLHPKDNSCLR